MNIGPNGAGAGHNLGSSSFAHSMTVRPQGLSVRSLGGSGRLSVVGFTTAKLACLPCQSTTGDMASGGRISIGTSVQCAGRHLVCAYRRWFNVSNGQCGIGLYSRWMCLMRLEYRRRSDDVCSCLILCLFCLAVVVNF